MTDSTIRTWTHSRKGRITGTITKVTGDWFDILLAEDHHHGDAGEVLTVRSQFLTEITKEQTKEQTR